MMRVRQTRALKQNIINQYRNTQPTLHDPYLTWSFNYSKENTIESCFEIV